MLPVIHIPYIGEVFTYPMVLGIALAFLFTNVSTINSELNILSKKRLLFFFLVIVVSSYIGAKVLFHLSSAQYDSDQPFYNYWVSGGLVFYGGYISGFLTAFLLLKFYKYKTTVFLPFLPYVIFAHAIGRIGCFLSGCCFGKTCPISFLERWPVQLIESIFLFILGFFIKYQVKKGNRYPFLKYVSIYAIFRLGVEFLRGDKIRGVWYFSLSTSQVVSIVLIILTAVFYLKESFSTKSSET